MTVSLKAFCYLTLLNTKQNNMLHFISLDYWMIPYLFFIFKTSAGIINAKISRIHYTLSLSMQFLLSRAYLSLFKCLIDYNQYSIQGTRQIFVQ